MSDLPKPPKFINPLWIIFMFFSFTEIVLGFVVFKLSGGIQIALIVFVIGFPLLVAIGFYLVLWYRPEHLYAPMDYGSSEFFIRSMENARKAREDLLNLDKKIDKKINVTLTSKRFVNKLSSIEDDKVKDLMAVTANNLSTKIRADSFFTIKLSTFSPQLKDLVVPIYAFRTFNDLTNVVYFALERKVKAYTYGTKWIMQESSSKKIIKHARMIKGIEPERFVLDSRTLEEAGIKAGMTLEVVLI